MPMAKVLIDCSFLVALYDPTDDGNLAAGTFLMTDTSEQIVPDVILTEVTYLLNRAVGQRGVELFLRTFEVTNPHLEPLQQIDLRRVYEILRTYPKAKLDFVDCCIMAMAERLNTTRVCTFDHRDFSIFRPTHCDYLELLP